MEFGSYMGLSAIKFCPPKKLKTQWDYVTWALRSLLFVTMEQIDVKSKALKVIQHLYQGTFKLTSSYNSFPGRTMNEASDERLNKIQEKALFVPITCLETWECLNSEFFHLSFINVHLPIGLLFTTLKNSLKHDTLAGLWVPHSRGALKIQLVRSGFYYSAWRRVINNSFVQAYYLLAVFC